MSFDKVASHYHHGNLLESIESVLHNVGLTKQTVTIDDLAGVDEFHIGGRLASEHLISQLKLSTDEKVLDIGCGLGGATRYVADTYNSQVYGIDLTDEYIQTGNELNQWLNLDDQISLVQGSALDLPFEEATFDGSYMMHVGMNIEDKAKLFSEVFRVLRPESYFAIYDVMRQSAGELSFPVPWAASIETSFLSKAIDYINTLESQGFKVVAQSNRQSFALEFFEKLKQTTISKGKPQGLSLQTLMQDSTAIKIKNMISNIANDLIAPVEIIVYKP